jgi:hypothetical protein
MGFEAKKNIERFMPAFVPRSDGGRTMGNFDPQYIAAMERLLERIRLKCRQRRTCIQSVGDCTDGFHCLSARMIVSDEGSARIFRRFLLTVENTLNCEITI